MIKTIVKFRTKKLSANLSPVLNILLNTRHVMHKDDMKQHSNSKKEQIQKLYLSESFEHQIYKMVRHTQTIRRQTADELFECV